MAEFYDSCIFSWKIALFFSVVSLVTGFMIGWTYRGIVVAKTILKNYYNQNYDKDGNVLYIDRFKKKSK